MAKKPVGPKKPTKGVNPFAKVIPVMEGKPTAMDPLSNFDKMQAKKNQASIKKAIKSVVSRNKK